MKLNNRLKKTIVIGSLGTLAISSFGFIESYFEISKNLDIFSSVYREINVNYVEETNPGSLVKTGIDAMLRSLDPYTNYIPESQIEDYRIMTTQEYGGIGALIGTQDGKIIITEPYKDSPADKAGLKAGDVIEAVNGITTEGKNTEQLSEMLKGQAGTNIKVRIGRPLINEEFEVTVTREKIKISDVPYYGMVDDKTGYISLRSFTETASRSVKEAYQKLQEQGMENVILDLRGNGGGLLDESVNIVNFFVPKGSPVVETKGKVKEHYSSYKALKEPLDTQIPMVVLIDENSASASEIVSGTLQDYDRAVLIGQNSFGKGLVQITKNISYNSIIKLTIAKYYTPSGRCIQRLDYGHRDEDGRALDVPDSLIKEFTTTNGRIVKDGAGIMPDIFNEPQEYSDLLITLLTDNIPFDYATEYFYKHDSIAPASQFALSDKEYNAFIDYVLTHNLEYKTSSTEMMKKLEEVIKGDEFWEEVDGEYAALKTKLERNVKNDMVKFKPEIKLFLETEIIGRYYYSQGQTEAYLTHDQDVKKALEVLNNKSMYTSVLDGTCETCLNKKR